MEVMGSAEVEAQNKAIKQVASLLLRADQLDKVEQYRRRTARKKVNCDDCAFIHLQICIQLSSLNNISILVV